MVFILAKNSSIFAVDRLTQNRPFLSRFIRGFCLDKNSELYVLLEKSGDSIARMEWLAEHFMNVIRAG